MSTLRAIGQCTGLPTPICRIVDDYAEEQTKMTEWQKEQICNAFRLCDPNDTIRQIIYYIDQGIKYVNYDPFAYISFDTQYTRTLDLWSVSAPSWPYRCEKCGRSYMGRDCCRRAKLEAITHI